MKHTIGKAWDVINQRDIHSSKIVHLIGDYYFYTSKNNIVINGKELLSFNPRSKFSIRTNCFNSDDAPNQFLFHYSFQPNTVYFLLTIECSETEFFPLSNNLLFSSLSEMLKAQKLLFLAQYSFDNIPTDSFLI